MDLQQLRYVVAVAEEGSFTAAADREGVAQPSVSAQIKTLEGELGLPLFSRGRSGAEPTAAGLALLPWARQALADCESGRAEVRALLGLRRGQLSLGATPSLTTSLVPGLLADFHRRHPGIGLRLRQAGSRDLVEELVAGRLDVALVILPVETELLATEPLAEEELVLAVRADHPLAGRRQVGVPVLRDLPLVLPREGYDVREAVLRACRTAGFTVTAAVEAGEMDSVLALTAAGLGASVVPSIVVDPDGPLRAVRFSGAGLLRTVGLAMRRDRPPSRAVAAFVHEVHTRLEAGWPGAPRAGLRLLRRDAVPPLNP
jgi:DNA-binding transcriptional LysR family regulator